MLPEWPDLLVMETSDLSLLTSPWRFFVAVYSTMVSAYLVERQLEYSATCSFRLLFAILIFLISARSSAVACARLENAIDISMALLAVPVLYPP